MSTRLHQEAELVFLTGDCEHREFSRALQPYRDRWEVVTIEQLLSDERWWQRPVDLLVIARSTSGQVLPEQISRLRRRYPLAAIVELLGSWCEGEDRWGLPPAHLPRVYWHKWPAEYERFRTQLQEQGVTQWHLPGTVARSERLITTHASQASDVIPKISKTVVVSASHCEAFEHIEDVLRTMGWSATWWQRTTEQVSFANVNALPAVAVINCDSSRVDPAAEFLQWAQSHLIPAVVVAGFVRFADSEQWLSELGISAVVSKPFENHELQRALVLADQSRSEKIYRIAGKAIA